jgi:hypothetical protein
MQVWILFHIYLDAPPSIVGVFATHELADTERRKHVWQMDPAIERFWVVEFEVKHD